jgi:ribose transport system ATP-binding protein
MERLETASAGQSRPPAMSARPTLVDMVEVTKRFPGGTALHGVDFDVRVGEVHALVGQNGAGKSTLMKILGGLYPDHGGEVRIGGQPARLTSPREAMRLGISVIHQEFSLVPSMTIAENILLGHEPNHGPVLRKRQIHAAAAAQLREVDLPLPLEHKVGAVGVATQQLTEIAKALSMRARVLVMDEPTARLSAVEKDKLFSIVRQLVSQDVAVVYISHFLEEIFEIADRVTVLRDGRVVATRPASELDIRGITSMMAGVETEGLTRRDRRQPQDTRPVVLQVNGLTREPFYRDIELSVREGEILGIGGLVGSGRSRLARAIVGVEPAAQGTITLTGRKVAPRSSGHALRLGIGLLPENRKTEGLVLTRPASDNIAMMALQTGLAKRGVVRLRKRQAMVSRLFHRLGIKPARPELEAQRFSGGNQQKIALAKVLAAGGKVLILDQPTAGVDVVTKIQLHDVVRELAAGGAAILLISDEIEELLALSDTIAVMRGGNLMHTASAHDVDREELLHLVTTGKAQGGQR